MRKVLLFLKWCIGIALLFGVAVFCINFICKNLIKPKELCESAWESILPFAKILANGGGNFYNGWMKNERSAMISCNDGFRPVSFYVEVID